MKFFAGMVAGQLLCVLSLRFLMTPRIDLNWPVVAAGCALLFVSAALATRGDHG